MCHYWLQCTWVEFLSFSRDWCKGKYINYFKLIKVPNKKHWRHTLGTTQAKWFDSLLCHCMTLQKIACRVFIPERGSQKHPALATKWQKIATSVIMLLSIMLVGIKTVAEFSEFRVIPKYGADVCERLSPSPTKIKCPTSPGFWPIWGYIHSAQGIRAQLWGQKAWIHISAPMQTTWHGAKITSLWLTLLLSLE